MYFTIAFITIKDSVLLSTLSKKRRPTVTSANQALVKDPLEVRLALEFNVTEHMEFTSLSPGKVSDSTITLL